MLSSAQHYSENKTENWTLTNIKLHRKKKKSLGTYPWFCRKKKTFANFILGPWKSDETTATKRVSETGGLLCACIEKRSSIVCPSAKTAGNVVIWKTKKKRRKAGNEAQRHFSHFFLRTHFMFFTVNMLGCDYKLHKLVYIHFTSRINSLSSTQLKTVAVCVICFFPPWTGAWSKP